MRQYLLDLYEIQKLDLEIREKQKHQDALPLPLRALEAQATALGAKIDALAEQHRTKSAESHKLRQVVEDETQKIRKWESRLNDIRNQREYQALSRETEGSKRQNRDAEEKIHELMRGNEAMEAELAGLKAKKEELEAQCSAERTQVEAAVQALRGTIDQQIARRDVLVPRIPKPLFRKYDAIRSRRFGMGLSMVVAGCCQGCNMKLPPQLYNILQRGDSIEQCPSCHRLIFWENILPSPEAETGGQSAAAHA